jgi:hypothetical protein
MVVETIILSAMTAAVATTTDQVPRQRRRNG